jgi:hypothetical protein
LHRRDQQGQDQPAMCEKFQHIHESYHPESCCTVYPALFMAPIRAKGSLVNLNYPALNVTRTTGDRHLSLRCTM